MLKRNQIWKCPMKLGLEHGWAEYMGCAQETRETQKLGMRRADVIWAKSKGLSTIQTKGANDGILSPDTNGVKWGQGVMSLTDPRPEILKKKKKKSFSHLEKEGYLRRWA